MSSTIRVAVLDACVLYPPSLRDFLLWLAAGSVYDLRLTEEIHTEWIRNALKDYPDLSTEKLARTRALMNAISSVTLVTGYEAIIETLTLPDPDDRHVLAAAIHAKAHVIVTFNLKDFPARVLSQYNLVAESPDLFVSGLMQTEGKRQEIIALARRGRQNLKNPPKTVEEYLDDLRRNRLSLTAELLTAHADEL